MFLPPCRQEMLRKGLVGRIKEQQVVMQNPTARWPVSSQSQAVQSSLQGYVLIIRLALYSVVAWSQSLDSTLGDALA